MNSRDFYIIKPPWVGDFGTVIKKFEIVLFSLSFLSVSRENFELVHAESALKNIF